MQLGFNPAAPHTATGFGWALSPFGQKRRKPLGCINQAGLAGGRAMAPQRVATGLEAPLGGIGQRTGALDNILHLLPATVAMQAKVAARRQGTLGALAERPAKRLHR